MAFKVKCITTIFKLNDLNDPNKVPASQTLFQYLFDFVWSETSWLRTCRTQVNSFYNDRELRRFVKNKKIELPTLSFVQVHQSGLDYSLKLRKSLIKKVVYSASWRAHFHRVETSTCFNQFKLNLNGFRCLMYQNTSSRATSVEWASKLATASLVT